jgi:hypothetical protein
MFGTLGDLMNSGIGTFLNNKIAFLPFTPTIRHSEANVEPIRNHVTKCHFNK